MQKITLLVILLLVGLVSSPLQAQASDGIKISAGVGLNYLNYTSDQQIDIRGYTDEFKLNPASLGVVGFVDLSQYFTAYLGYRFAVGKYQASESFTPAGVNDSASIDQTVSQLDLGVELKYPFRINSGFSLAPKIGLEDVIYIGGKINGYDLSSDGKTIFSPLLLTLGADLNFDLTPQIFIRVPFDLGIGFNSKLSDSYYTAARYTYNGNPISGTYSSSSVFGFKLGAFVGYNF